MCCPHCGHDHDAEMSNLTVGGKRLTWKEAAEHYMTQTHEARRFKTLLLDLDRCEHGRHEGDVCSSCGGPSHGNPAVQERHLGYDLSGRPIVIPDRHRSHIAEAWLADEAERVEP